MTEILLAVSDVVQNYWYLLPGIPVVVILVWKGISSTPKGKFMLDKLLLYMPVFGTIIHKSTISRFARTLGTLIASGVPILESLSITREATGNDVVAKAIDDVHTSIREGESIAKPLQESGVFDDMLVNMIDIGEETGDSTRCRQDRRQTTTTTSSRRVAHVDQRSYLIVGMGGAVGFIVIAVPSPIELIQAVAASVGRIDEADAARSPRSFRTSMVQKRPLVAHGYGDAVIGYAADG